MRIFLLENSELKYKRIYEEIITKTLLSFVCPLLVVKTSFFYHILNVTFVELDVRPLTDFILSDEVKLILIIYKIIFGFMVYSLTKHRKTDIFFILT